MELHVQLGQDIGWGAGNGEGVSGPPAPPQHPRAQTSPSQRPPGRGSPFREGREGSSTPPAAAPGLPPLPPPPPPPASQSKTLASEMSLTAAASTMFLMTNFLMALSLGTQRAQLVQRMGWTCPRPFLARPLFLLFFVWGAAMTGMDPRPPQTPSAAPDTPQSPPPLPWPSPGLGSLYRTPHGLSPAPYGAWGLPTGLPETPALPAPAAPAPHGSPLPHTGPPEPLGPPPGRAALTISLPGRRKRARLPRRRPYIGALRPEAPPPPSRCRPGSAGPLRSMGSGSSDRVGAVAGRHRVAGAVGMVELLFLAAAEESGRDARREVTSHAARGACVVIPPRARALAPRGPLGDEVPGGDRGVTGE